MGSRGEEGVREKYDQVCRELNLDQESMEAAWASYVTINNDYVLEVRKDYVGSAILCRQLNLWCE